MRQRTHKVVTAFLAGKKLKIGNTSTDGSVLRLHGNIIADKDGDGQIAATLAGWPTATTRDRLNGLCELIGLGRPFNQSKYRQFFGKSEISCSEWIDLRGK